MTRKTLATPLRLTLIAGVSILSLSLSAGTASATDSRKPLPTPSETLQHNSQSETQEATPTDILGGHQPEATPTGEVKPPVDNTQIRDFSAGAPVGEITLVHKLTPESITKYYNASKIVHGRDWKDYQNYFYQHTNLEADITHAIVTHTPDKKVKRETLEMTKDDYLALLEKTYQESQGADISHKITSLNIAADGQSAKAQDVTILSNILEVPRADDPRKKVKLHLQMQSSCNDDFVISYGAIPQIMKSACTVERYFFVKPPKAR